MFRLSDLTSVVSARLVGNAITAIFWLVLAFLLGPEDYAEVIYYLAIAYLLSVVSFLGAGNTLVVFTAKGVELLKTLSVITILTSALTAIILFFIYYNIGISLHVIGFVIFGLIIYEQLGKKLYRSFSKLIILQKILMVIFSTSLYFLIGVNGIILGIGVSFLPFSFQLVKELRHSKLNFLEVKPRFGFMMNSYGLDLSRNFPVYADKLVILPLFGLSLLGNYQLGIQILLAMSVLPISIYEFTLSRDASGLSTKKLKIITVIISVVFATLGYFLSPVFIPVLFPKFNEAVEIIQWISLAIIPITISLMYNSKFLGTEKSKFVFIGSGIFLSIQILGIILLGQIYGILGAVIALILAATIQAIFLIISNEIIVKLKPSS